MSDDKFIQEIARMWVELGGDAEGVAWNWMKLRDAVAELEVEGEK